eukprot:6173712-Pleurochrysis_carterae.AAC.1
MEVPRRRTTPPETLSPFFPARCRSSPAASAASWDVPQVTSPAADFYPCELSAEASAAVSAASKAWCALTGASSGEEVDAAALAALDETLAVAASAAAVEEGGLADVLREAFEAVKDEYDAALAPERQARAHQRRLGLHGLSPPSLKGDASTGCVCTFQAFLSSVCTRCLVAYLLDA